MKSSSGSEAAVGCLLILMAPLLGIWNAFAVTKLWAWFVVAQFSVGPLSIPVAYGLCLIVWLVTHKPSKQDDDALKNGVNAAVVGVLAPAISMLFGYMAKGFM